MKFRAKFLQENFRSIFTRAPLLVPIIIGYDFLPSCKIYDLPRLWLAAYQLLSFVIHSK